MPFHHFDADQLIRFVREQWEVVFGTIAAAFVAWYFYRKAVKAKRADTRRDAEKEFVRPFKRLLNEINVNVDPFFHSNVEQQKALEALLRRAQDHGLLRMWVESIGLQASIIGYNDALQRAKTMIDERLERYGTDCVRRALRDEAVQNRLYDLRYYAMIGFSKTYGWSKAPSPVQTAGWQQAFCIVLHNCGTHPQLNQTVGPTYDYELDKEDWSKRLPRQVVNEAESFIDAVVEEMADANLPRYRDDIIKECERLGSLRSKFLLSRAGPDDG